MRILKALGSDASFVTAVGVWFAVFIWYPIETAGTLWKWLMFAVSAITVTVSITFALSAVRGLMGATQKNTDTEGLS